MKIEKEDISTEQKKDLFKQAHSVKRIDVVALVAASISELLGTFKMIILGLTLPSQLNHGVTSDCFDCNIIVKLVKIKKKLQYLTIFSYKFIFTNQGKI